MSDLTDLTAVSLFAGIGGIDRALELAGVKVTAAVEIDPDCRAVLACNFPQTALFNDVTEVTGDQLRATGFVPERGILTGGFPCQDLSVAGRRKGLAGARSGLFWHVMRLADELRPRWLLLENVPGLLSSVCPCAGDETCMENDRAVRCGQWEKRDGKRVFIPHVTHTPTGGACPGGCMERHGGAMGTVLGALGERGYGFAYRVLDAQFFGVPQRRERVFIAGRLGDRAAPVQVLLEPESGDGNPAAGGPARARVAPAAGRSTVSALQGGGRRGHRIDAEGAAGGHLIAHAITAREGKGADSDAVSGLIAVPVVAATLTMGNAVGKGVSKPGRRREDDINLVAQPVTGTIARTLTSEGADASEDGTGRGTPIVAVPVAWRGRGMEAGEAGIANALRSAGDGHVGDQMGYVMSLAVAGDFSAGENVAQTVRAAHGQPGAVSNGTTIRRLTPLECERLQGFPDRWTLRQADGREQSDSTRYRQLGNSVAVPCVAWITRRIVAAEARLSAAKGEAA